MRRSWPASQHRQINLLPAHRAPGPLEWTNDPAGDPAPVEAAGLRNNLLALHGAAVNERGHHGDRASDRLEAVPSSCPAAGLAGIGWMVTVNSSQSCPQSTKLLSMGCGGWFSNWPIVGRGAARA
jgi:hypothetical protein